MSALIARNKILIQIFFIFVLTLTVYLLSNHNRFDNYNYFVRLAEAFLNGRLGLSENPPWLNELVEVNGNFYVVYPPMPAIVLMPAVFLFGSGINQALLSIFLGSLNAVLCYLVVLRVFKKEWVAFWVAILSSFGTIQWYHAQAGSSWYVAHIVAIFFLWLMILESVTKKRLFLVGLFLGLAYLSRLPTILAIVFVGIFLHQVFFPRKEGKIDVDLKAFALFGLGLAPAVLFNWTYNFERYGTIEDLGYSLLPIFDEPWYQHGLFNIRYIPTHFKEMFTALPKFRDTFPYVVPSLYVMAIWVTTPAFILALFANYKTKIALSSLIGILVLSIPTLMHGNNGFTQFGYRYTMDFMPFTLLLTASGLRGNVSWWKVLLIFISVLINLWGVVMISFLGIWMW